MGSTTLIPVSEYLATSYRPDCDYVDGEVRERNLGELPHAVVQGAIISLLRQYRREWNIRVLPEQRVQVTATRFRVPDVCVVSSGDSIDPILREPPLLCVEVLSSKDSFQRMHERVEEYLAMGVPMVWILDPVRREVWTSTAAFGTQRLSGDELTVPGTRVLLRLADVFEELDEATGL